MAFYFAKIGVNLVGVRSNIHTHKYGLSKTCRINNMDERYKKTKTLSLRAGHLNGGSVGNTNGVKPNLFLISFLGIYRL